jgi:class 3 adenylate cyclase
MSDFVPGPDDLPAQFDRYRILRRLGKGGMGAVYLAVDTRLDRQVALKVPFLRDNDEIVLHRFQQEARALARLHHPNLCAVYDSAEHGGIHYLTMRYIEGASLRECIASHRGRAGVALVETLARALAVVHAAGVVHRDVKPENIIIDARNQPVIVDFGLALRSEELAQGSGSEIQGTLPYMAPEQQRGEGAIGPACDIYSLGVLLYELLTGQVPFHGDFFQVLDQKRLERYPPLQQFGMDAILEGLCQRALRPDPSARFASMTDFADRLAGYLRDEVGALPAPAAPAERVKAVSTMLHPMDPRVAGEVLELLREWGWDVGMSRLEARILTLDDNRRRGVLRLLGGWIKGERGAHAAALEQFHQAEEIPELTAWARVGQAFIRYRERKYDEAWDLFDQAGLGAASDHILQATIDHGRGALRYRQGRDDEALEFLYRAAERFGTEHFGFGRVLDTLGMVYTAKDNFPTARALFEKALQAKEKHHDLLGQALTHGQLGRLLLDWGEVGRSEKEFRKDLALCQQTNDSLGEAQMWDHLGQVMLERRQLAKALEYLTESVARNQAGGWTANEAYARKDRARVLLAMNRLKEAEHDAREAERLGGQAEVTFHARRVLALVLAARDQFAESEALLRQAAIFFQDKKERAEAARAWLELARVQKRRPGVTVAVVESLRVALAQADLSRRDQLINEIERELGTVDREELFLRAFCRARGTGIPDVVGALDAVEGEKATILFLDLRNFTGFSLTQDPRVVRLTLNQIFADLAVVVERHEIVVNQYLGDGFMALVRDKEHARRAVAGAVEMQEAVAAFNRPRQLLGKQLLEARIGICTGDVVFGNVGTYRKLDFTAVGPTTNMAARLQNEARPGAVCISAETQRLVQGEFAFADPAGRLVSLKGIGEVRVWDVIGRQAGAATAVWPQ